VSSFNHQKLRKLPGNPILVLTPSGPTDFWTMSSLRFKHWRSMLANLVIEPSAVLKNSSFLLKILQAFVKKVIILLVFKKIAIFAEKSVQTACNNDRYNGLCPGPTGDCDDAVDGEVSWRHYVDGPDDVAHHQVLVRTLPLAAAVAEQRVGERHAARSGQRSIFVNHFQPIISAECFWLKCREIGNIVFGRKSISTFFILYRRSEAILVSDCHSETFIVSEVLFVNRLLFR
jgi:hypothetical protein